MGPAPTLMRGIAPGVLPEMGFPGRR
jgi:hypothetical protein